MNQDRRDRATQELLDSMDEAPQAYVRFVWLNPSASSTGFDQTLWDSTAKNFLSATYALGMASDADLESPESTLLRDYDRAKRALFEFVVQHPQIPQSAPAARDPEGDEAGGQRLYARNWEGMAMEAVSYVGDTDLLLAPVLSGQREAANSVLWPYNQPQDGKDRGIRPISTIQALECLYADATQIERLIEAAGIEEPAITRSLREIIRRENAAPIEAMLRQVDEALAEDAAAARDINLATTHPGTLGPVTLLAMSPTIRQRDMGAVDTLERLLRAGADLSVQEPVQIAGESIPTLRTGIGWMLDAMREDAPALAPAALRLAPSAQAATDYEARMAAATERLTDCGHQQLINDCLAAIAMGAAKSEMGPNKEKPISQKSRARTAVL